MAYRLPEEIENALQKEFPQVAIKKLVNRLFELVTDKTIYEGGCHIRQFGKFIAYPVYSTRTGKKVVRFKYRISASLTNAIKDTYVINNIPSKPSAAFDAQNEEKCKDKKDHRQLNIKSQQYASKVGKETTKKKIVEDEVINIISNTKLNLE
jgi:hypothetical protein